MDWETISHWRNAGISVGMLNIIRLLVRVYMEFDEFEDAVYRDVPVMMDSLIIGKQGPNGSHFNQPVVIV